MRKGGADRRRFGVEGRESICTKEREVESGNYLVAS